MIGWWPFDFIVNNCCHSNSVLRFWALLYNIYDHMIIHPLPTIHSGCNTSELQLCHNRRGRKAEGAGRSKMAKSLSEHEEWNWKHFFPILILTQSMALTYKLHYISWGANKQKKDGVLLIYDLALSPTSVFVIVIHN